MACSTCSKESHFVYQKLIQMVTDGSLDISSVLENLGKIKNLNRYDVLITTLMAINEFTNIDPNIKAEINNEILYLLKRRYLKINSYTDLRQGFPQIGHFQPRAGPGLSLVNFNRQNPPILVPKHRIYPQPRPVVNLLRPLQPILRFYPPQPNVISGQSNNCNCQTQIIEMLLNRIIALENRRKHTSSCGSNYSEGYNGVCVPRVNRYPWNIPSIKPPSENNTAKKPLDNVDLVRNLISKVPLLPQGQVMYRKFRDLLQNPQVQNIIKNIDLSKYPPDEILTVIITTVMHTIHTKEIEEVFAYFLNYKEAAKTGFNYAILVELLPQPKNLQEQNYYNLIKNLLLSKIIYNTKLSSKFIQATNLTDKLIILIQELLAGNTISSQTKKALLYFLPIIKGRRANIFFENLVSLLPTPETEIEKKYFEQIKQLFESYDLYIIMKDIDLRNLTPAQRLKIILDQLVTPNSQFRDLASFYREQLILKKYGFHYSFLITQITESQENQQYIQILRDYFFYNPELEAILAQLNFTSLSGIERLTLVLEALKQSSSDPKVVQAAAFILEDFQLQNFYKNLQQIINLLPQPKTNIEKQQYEIVKSFVLSRQGFALLKSIDTSMFPNNKLLLEFILRTVAESQISENIRNAFEFYIDLNEKLQALEFVTKKEIKKKFKLTEIFVDTLDLKSLNLEQKNAFKKFFKYISEIKPDAMSNFDSWDQAKTRGEFMKLLFKFLLESQTTHPEIKESIKILNMAVKMDGKAALPP